MEAADRLVVAPHAVAMLNQDPVSALIFGETTTKDPVTVTTTTEVSLLTE
jgi:hypothetical protein